MIDNVAKCIEKKLGKSIDKNKAKIDSKVKLQKFETQELDEELYVGLCNLLKEKGD